MNSDEINETTEVILDTCNPDKGIAKAKRGPKPKADAAYKQADYKEQKKAYAKKYYVNNREKMLNSMKELVACNCCGRLTGRNNMTVHKKTKRCQKVQELAKAAIKNIEYEKNIEE